MNKKYQIVNSNQNENSTFFYLLYIVLILVIIFLIYKISLYLTPSANIDNFTTTQMLTPGQQMESLQQENVQLVYIKNTLENILSEQSRGIYLSTNYNKIDESSFNDEVNFINTDFDNINLPSIDLSNSNVISTQAELNNVLSEVSLMKNYYNSGDIVTANSTFNISKNDICYRSNGKPINPDPSFVKNYPNCMVCSTESPETLSNSNAWQHTRTNINKVCLFNPTSEANSGIPNMQQCKQFCNIPN